MNTIIAIIILISINIFFIITFYCLFVSASRTDEYIEKMFIKEKEDIQKNLTKNEVNKHE